MKYSSTFFLVFFGAKRAARKEGEEYQNLEWLNLTIEIFTEEPLMRDLDRPANEP